MSGSELTPALLVAMPQLLDPNFKRGVVLLIHHGEDGSFGVVLNRTTEIDAKTLFDSLEIVWRGDPAEPIDWGGPVQPETGWVLFEPPAGLEAAEEVSEAGQGICFAGTLEVLRQLAQEPPARMRLLLGYAGWSPGQLEAELAEGAWLVAPVTPEVVFEVERPAMWEHVVRGLGIEPATLVATRGVH